MKHDDPLDAARDYAVDQMLSRAQDQLCCCKCPRTSQWQDASNGTTWNGALKWCSHHVLDHRDWGGVIAIVPWEEAVRL